MASVDFGERLRICGLDRRKAGMRWRPELETRAVAEGMTLSLSNPIIISDYRLKCTHKTYFVNTSQSAKTSDEPILILNTLKVGRK